MYLHFMVGLFVCTALYALLLDRFKERFEPHYTWLEVVIGVFVVLLFAYFNVEVNKIGNVIEVHLTYWLSFIVGSVPIIIWRMYRQHMSHVEVMDYHRQHSIRP